MSVHKTSKEADRNINTGRREQVDRLPDRKTRKRKGRNMLIDKTTRPMLQAEKMTNVNRVQSVC